MIKNYSDWLNEKVDIVEIAKTADPAQVDPKELAVGKEVEMEHTFDEVEAEKIALQHLSEDPHYYKKLRDAGLIDEPEALQKAKDLNENEMTNAEKTLWKATYDFSIKNGDNEEEAQAAADDKITKVRKMKNTPGILRR